MRFAIISLVFVMLHSVCLAADKKDGGEPTTTTTLQRGTSTTRPMSNDLQQGNTADQSRSQTTTGLEHQTKRPATNTLQKAPSN
jgi:hypothetical protein